MVPWVLLEDSSGHLRLEDNSGALLLEGVQYTVLGPAGAPMRPPWGSFAGKLPAGGDSRPYTQQFTVMGPAGAPMRPPWGSFSGRAPVVQATLGGHPTPFGAMHNFGRMGS